MAKRIKKSIPPDMVDDGIPSRTELKRESDALQEIGERLLALPKEKIKALDIDPKLKEAALFSKTIKAHKHEAIRRHRQFIGKLMRQIAKPEEVASALDFIDHTKRKADDRFHEIERFRDRLVAGELDATEDVLAQYPHADRQRLRQLALAAAREAAKNKPPKSARALFKYLREVSGG